MTKPERGSDSVPDSDERMESGEGRWAVALVVLLRTGLVAGVLLVLMQFVPYGWAHDNPPVVSDAPWPDAASEGIARESCYSCHSNETEWPVYSYVAPMSWLVRFDVDRGRDAFNFSDWDSGDADDAIEMIEDGDMPLGRYTLIHRDAELDARERDILIEALTAMSGDDEHDGSEGEHD